LKQLRLPFRRDADAGVAHREVDDRRLTTDERLIS
jgi:hypothetical protein